MKGAVKNLWGLGRAAVNGWLDDRAPSMGAALAYYTVFSLSPLLLIAISIAGLLFDPDAARDAVVSTFGGLVGENGAQAVRSLIANAQDTTQGVIATIVGAVALVIGATTVFAELQTDLDLIWKVPPRTSAGLWNFFRSRFLSFGMVLAIGFLLLASLLVNAALAALGSAWQSSLGDLEPLLHVLDLMVSFVVITAMFALIYKLLPSAPIAWSDVWIGAAVTSLLFSLGKLGIGLYLGKSALASSFGAAGALVVLIVWLYYSTQIFLLGAEFTFVYARRHGSHAATTSAPMNAPALAAYRAPSAANDPATQAPFPPAQPGGLSPRIESVLAFMRKHPQATLG